MLVAEGLAGVGFVAREELPRAQHAGDGPALLAPAPGWACEGSRARARSNVGALRGFLHYFRFLERCIKILFLLTCEFLRRPLRIV